ncbi:MAG TPA: chemotaxis protein CheB, partial [Sorangium sp.]|nr:chemotaxis protein CheB [Sorangium sp.]
MPEHKKTRRTQFRATGQRDSARPLGGGAASRRELDPSPGAGGSSAADEPYSGGDLRCLVVCVVAAAGGRGAVAELLRRLPSRDTCLALVLIYSADPGETPSLELATQSSPLPVIELRQGTRLTPGHVHVLPPGTRATLAGPSVELAPR